MAGPRAFFELVVRNSSIVVAEPTSKRIWNVFHWRRTGAGSSLTATQTAAAAWSSLSTAYLAALSINTSVDADDGRFIDDATSAYETTALGVTGAITGDNLPSLNAVVCLLGTAVRGRSAHGRKFFGLVAESDTTSDGLISAAVTRYQAILTAYLGGFTDPLGNVWVPIIVSRKQSQLKINPCTVVSNDVTTGQVETILGRLKRRQEPKR